MYVCYKCRNCHAVGRGVGLQSLNQVFRGFFVALPEIESMGLFAAGMAVDLDELAAFFASKLRGMFFHLSAEAIAAGCFVDRKVADAGEVAREGDLGDKVKGEQAEDGCRRRRGCRGGAPGAGLAGESCSHTSRISAGSESSWARRASMNLAVSG